MLYLSGNNVTVSGLSTNANVGAPIVENFDTVTAATLTVNDTVASTFAGSLQDGGGFAPLSLVKAGSGTLTLSGSNTFTGGVTINVGALAVGNAGALNSSTPNAVTFGAGSTGQLILNGNSIAVSSLSTNATVGTPVVENSSSTPATLTVNATGTNTFAGSFQDGGSGPLSLTMAGSGTLALTGNNTATGNININNGTLIEGLAGGSGAAFSANVAVGVGASFIYNSGTFGGALINSGTVTLNAPFIAGNGMTNNTSLTIAAGQSITLNGNGLTNNGTLVMAGGTLSASGVSNLGTLTMSGGTLSVGVNTFFNGGNMNLSTSWYLGNDSLLANYGSFALSAGTIGGSSPFFNYSVLSGTGSILCPFENNGGVIAVGAGSLVITSGFSNNGLIELTGAVSNFSNGGSGELTVNTGAIQGVGNVNDEVNNSSGGTVEGIGGTLTFAGGYLTNQAGGLLAADAGSKLLLVGGLYGANAGIISLTGGTFDNGGYALNNTGEISGWGIFRTGGTGLDNNGSITLTGGMTTVNGPVTNGSGHTITVAYNPVIFTSMVTNNSGGTFETTSTTATFAGGFTNNGTFISDPSTLGFTSLAIGPSGTIQASAGDLYQVTGNFTNASTQSSTWNAAGATLQFTGGGAHTMNVSGSVGSYGWGTLQIASGNTLQINGNSATATVTENAGTIDQTSGSSASLGVVSGSGNLIVGDGSNPSELTATQILQTTLTINAGSTVTIAPSGAGIPAVEASDSVASDSNVADATSTPSSDSSAATSSDPFLAIQAAIASGAISGAKGEQLENRIAAIERLAATDPGLDVSLLENRVLSSLPSSIWSSADASSLVESGSRLLGVESSLPASDSSGASAAFFPSSGIGNPAAVPEPSTLLLAALGGIGLAAAAHRRRIRRNR